MIIQSPVVQIKKGGSLLFILLMPLLLLSQNSKYTNVWCFGKNAGVNFNGAAPVAFSGTAMNTNEGCSSICNSAGQLLFYTDGEKVWDKNHATMPRATGVNWNKKLSGNASSTQSALIVPHICDTNKYYIFTTDGGSSIDMFDPKGAYDGLFYTVVDMTLNGGKGDIDVAYLTTQPGYKTGANKIGLVDSVNEKIAATLHSSGIGFWITAQRENGDFYSFKVDCGGVDTTAVKSLGLCGTYVNYADMAFSKDGKCLLVAGLGGMKAAMFDFDNLTGVVSNPQILINDMNEIGTAWSVCFSPNDSVIYISAWASTKYKRFDRFAANVLASGVVGNIPVAITMLQLGPDGKLYATNNTSNTGLSCFSTPNNFTNPGFVANAINLAAGTGCTYGLPNVFIPKTILKPTDFVRTDTTFCIGNQIELHIGKPALDCFTYSWEPPVGLDDATSGNPVAAVNQTTTFKVTASSPCKTYVDSVTITIESCDEESAAFFPNAFSPNEDGLNDIFLPSLYEYVNSGYDLKIFDRWGELIYSTTNQKQGWNGCYRDTSKPVQEDVYVYKLYAVDKFGVEIHKLGHVSLLR